MSAALKEINKILEAKSTASHTTFAKTIVPGTMRIYGVKTPILNDIAKKYRAGSFSLAEELWNSGSLEEKIIAIKIIEKEGKADPGKTLSLFRKFSKTIDNWAVCDGLGMQFLSGVRKTETKAIFDLAKKYNLSKDPWQRRLSLVMVEWYTRFKEFHPTIKQFVRTLEKDDDYYVRKAVVWINKNFSKGK